MVNQPIIAELNNKRVLVTGATGGIGTCVVQMLAGEGAEIGIHYHQNKKKAEALSMSST